MRKPDGPARGVLLAAAALVAAALLAGARPAPADEASKNLQKYEKPVDEAIDRALDYLAKKQHKDGCWLAGGEKRDPMGITSLCLMAFLAKGYTPGEGPYAEVIDKGIDFVLNGHLENGLIAERSGHGAMYSHCIATLMLSEVSGMVDPERQAKIDRLLPKALKIIIAAQDIQKDDRNAGGWRYQSNSSDSDISCTSWAVMALRSVRNAGAAVPKGAIERALAYIM